MTPSPLSTADFSALLDAFSQPAAILSDDYRIISANQPYKDHYAQVSDVTDLHCYQVSHGYERPCDQEGELCPLKGCQATGLRQRVLHLHDTCHGQEHVDVEMLPIPKGAKNPQYFLEIMHLVKVANAQPKGEGLVGCSSAFNHMISLIQRAAPSQISVLLLGESGTGKELVAKALHVASTKAAQPFVTVECSGLSEALFESEMFGHEKGAFTGAVNKKEGLVTAARGGTLFLDEVGDIPLSLQVKLLRLIETGTYRTVGGLELKHADFRLVCATHRDLSAKVDDGTFRQDLYYRISSFPIEIPSLRERTEDIRLLIDVLLRRISDADEVLISPEALSYLKAYHYPGNIRELRNILERAVLLADNRVIESEHLPAFVTDFYRTSELVSGLLPDQLIPLAELELTYLKKLKQEYPIKNRQLAEQLGVSERTLYRKLQGL